MEEIIKKFDFLTFEKEEIEMLADVDLQMAYIYNYIKNVYKYCDYKVYYWSTYLVLSKGIPIDLYLIEINGVIVRFIELTNNVNIKYNTYNMVLAKKQIKKVLERRLPR